MFIKQMVPSDSVILFCESVLMNTLLPNVPDTLCDLLLSIYLLHFYPFLSLNWLGQHLDPPPS